MCKITHAGDLIRITKHNLQSTNDRADCYASSIHENAYLDVFTILQIVFPMISIMLIEPMHTRLYQIGDILFEKSMPEERNHQ